MEIPERKDYENASLYYVHFEPGHDDCFYGHSATTVRHTADKAENGRLGTVSL
jgi:hypothetical protein